MKPLFSILFLMALNLLFSQQSIEICEQGETYTYSSNFGGDGQNTWFVNGVSYPGDDLMYTFTNPGIYNIILRRDNGLCYVEETYEVLVTECEETLYWISNSFTPDGDEHNQSFGPVMTEGYDFNGFSFSLFNRWGELIWESKDPRGRWDGTYRGKDCPDGIYSWFLKFNVSRNGKRIEDFGHVILLK